MHTKSKKSSLFFLFKPSKTDQNDLLKLIALITMTIDHIGLLFFPEDVLLRIIGRIAFPIFAYGIARGIEYTSDRKRYLFRLLVFTLISAIPYKFLNEGATFDPYSINQIAQLLYSAIVLIVIDEARKEKHYLYPLAVFLTFLPDALVYHFRAFSFAYGSYGILISVVFFLIKEEKEPWLFFAIVAVTFYYRLNLIVMNLKPMEASFLWAHCTITLADFKEVFIVGQDFAFLSLPIIHKVNGMKEKIRIPKYLSYWYYPVHITVLVVLYHLIH
ncbi:TraX family protein [Guggenheimella bovis]